jgi:fructokinase
MQGISHPEVGHMMIPQAPEDMAFSGSCDFHNNCLEGLASGTAIHKRWQIHPKNLPPEHPAWDLESHYLAVMCVNLTWMYAPEKIIFGGGVMTRSFLYPKIRTNLKKMLSGYAHDAALNDMERYIIPTALGGDAGITGALALARRVYLEARR